MPTQCVTNDQIETERGLAPGSLLAQTGVAQRYVCAGESQIDLAVGACHAALQAAGCGIGDIDLLISGAAVPYQPIPAMAPILLGALGAADGAAAGFDVNSTCLSFVTALETAARMIAAGQHKRALVVSAERASRALPWETAPQVAGLFGDGAGAVVLSEAGDKSPSRIVASHMRSYPSGVEICEIGSGGTRFDFTAQAQAFADHATFMMDGRALFRLTAQHFQSVVTELLDQAGWARDAVDLIVPHQASPAGLAHMIRLTGFAPDRVMDITADYGNQVAASIPVALDLAWRDGRIARGDKVLLLGTSAGVSIGGLALIA